MEAKEREEDKFRHRKVRNIIYTSQVRLGIYTQRHVCYCHSTTVHYKAEETPGGIITIAEGTHECGANTSDVGAANYQPLLKSTMQESDIYSDVKKCSPVQAQLSDLPSNYQLLCTSTMQESHIYNDVKTKGSPAVQAQPSLLPSYSKGEEDEIVYETI